MLVKRRVVFYVVIGLVMLVAAACAGGDDAKDESLIADKNEGASIGGSSDSREASSPVLEKSDVQAELVIYGVSNAEEEFNDRWGNDLREQFPNITFTYIQNEQGKSLSELIMANQPIDILFDSIGSAPSTLIENGFEYDITDLARAHGVDLARFEPTFLDSIRQMGGLYGLPVNGGGLVIYYNKDIFDHFGVEYPTDGMTWDELLDLSKRVTRQEDGKQYAGFAASVAHPMRMNPYSLDVVDMETNTAAIDNDLWRKMMEYMVVLPITQDEGYRELYASRNGGLWTGDFVGEQNLAMFMMNFGLQYAVPEFETMNWDMVSIPIFDDLPGVGSQPYPNFFFITSSSKHKDAAMEVLKYVTSDEHVMKESRKGNIPVLVNEDIKEMFGQDTVYKDKNMKNAVFYNAFAVPHRKTIYDNLVAGPLDAQLKRVILGEIDLNTAFRNAVEEANQAIAERVAAQK